MATPMTTTQIVAQLKKWGVNFKEEPDWETRNRNHVKAWGPVHGFMWHHTGSDSSTANQLSLLKKGYATLPGPLCNFGIATTGVCHLVGWGRANHAGLGDDDVLNALIAEDVKFPVDNEANTDGNSRMYGAEFMYSGSHHMTEAQFITGILLSCAIIDFHGWNENSIIGHGQWQPGKWDPGYKSGTMMDMEAVQKDIATRYAKGPKYVAPPPVADANKPEAKPKVYKDVWNTDSMRKPGTHPSTTNTYWEPESILRYAAEQAAEANRKADLIMKHLGLS
jgi:hypothetical protein